MGSGLILIVDDEVSVRNALCSCLEIFGFQTRTAARGQDAISLARNNPFDAVLLDINMPGMSGVDTCRNLRAMSPDLPILMLTVRDSEDDKVQLLDAGANDYITKPFALRELVARIRAATRWSRSSQSRVPAVLRIGEIELDTLRHTVKKANRPVHLTPKEYTLTYQLMIDAGKPIPYSHLLNVVWGPEYAAELEYLRTFMYQLRRKLETDPAHPKYLLTVSQVGYRFAETA